MSEAGFWKIIEDSRDEALKQGLSLPYGREFQGLFLKEMTKRLESTSADKVFEFQRFIERKQIELFREDLWAIAYIIHGGCSDDRFQDFRNFIISQGKDFFDLVLKDPATVGDLAVPGQDLYFESLSFAPIEIYEKWTGKEYEPLQGPCVEASGESWTDDDLPQLYPNLCIKFGFSC